METLDLITYSGIAAVTTVIVGLIKPAIKLSGRGTHVATVVCAIGIAIASRLSGLAGTEGPWLTTVMTGVLAAATAVGMHQAVKYEPLTPAQKEMK